MKVDDLNLIVHCLQLANIGEIELIAQLNTGEDFHFETMGMYVNKGLNEAVLIFEKEKEI